MYRIKAKLIGYLQPDYALKKYSRADTSIAGRYGRSVALWRLGDQIAPAVELIDQLIALEPKKPISIRPRPRCCSRMARSPRSIAPFKQAAALAPKNTDENPHRVCVQALLEIDELQPISRSPSTS